ncbi:gluconate 2-dehydrogenase subunit 3 family protein [Pedobacter sp. ASV1-7]|uniref:gluconate 2-dehydrogenase subunit 3 family protein n=1 Tax=Pedobacter sp. ASV1-7 TaxID=3145237 RepID=UPI0032E8C904
MDRRTTLKGILTLSFLGVSSFSAYKWFFFHKSIDSSSIIAYKELIAELAETIIPLTDTPGAKAANVENYILNVILNCTETVEQNIFLNGLRNIERYAMDKYDKSYLKCTLDERNQILEHFEAKSVYPYQIINKINKKLFGKPFFTQLKNLTVEGYCNSHIGATQGLAYDYIPGSFESCIPLKSHQRSWATK